MNEAINRNPENAREAKSDQIQARANNAGKRPSFFPQPVGVTSGPLNIDRPSTTAPIPEPTTPPALAAAENQRPLENTNLAREAGRELTRVLRGWLDSRSAQADAAAVTEARESWESGRLREIRDELGHREQGRREEATRQMEAFFGRPPEERQRQQTINDFVEGQPGGTARRRELVEPAHDTRPIAGERRPRSPQDLDYIVLPTGTTLPDTRTLAERQAAFRQDFQTAEGLANLETILTANPDDLTWNDTTLEVYNTLRSMRDYPSLYLEIHEQVFRRLDDVRLLALFDQFAAHRPQGENDNSGLTLAQYAEELTARLRPAVPEAPQPRGTRPPKPERFGGWDAFMLTVLETAEARATRLSDQLATNPEQPYNDLRHILDESNVDFLPNLETPEERATRLHASLPPEADQALNALRQLREGNNFIGHLRRRIDRARQLRQGEQENQAAWRQAAVDFVQGGGDRALLDRPRRLDIPAGTERVPIPPNQAEAYRWTFDHDEFLRNLTELQQFGQFLETPEGRRNPDLVDLLRRNGLQANTPAEIGENINLILTTLAAARERSSPNYIGLHENIYQTLNNYRLYTEFQTNLATQIPLGLDGQLVTYDRAVTALQVRTHLVDPVNYREQEERDVRSLALFGWNNRLLARVFHGRELARLDERREKAIVYSENDERLRVILQAVEDREEVEVQHGRVLTTNPILSDEQKATLELLERLKLAIPQPEDAPALRTFETNVFYRQSNEIAAFIQRDYSSDADNSLFSRLFDNSAERRDKQEALHLDTLLTALSYERPLTKEQQGFLGYLLNRRAERLGRSTTFEPQDKALLARLADVTKRRERGFDIPSLSFPRGGGQSGTEDQLREALERHHDLRSGRIPNGIARWWRHARTYNTLFGTEERRARQESQRRRAAQATPQPERPPSENASHPANTRNQEVATPPRQVENSNMRTFGMDAATPSFELETTAAPVVPAVGGVAGPKVMEVDPPPLFGPGSEVRKRSVWFRAASVPAATVNNLFAVLTRPITDRLRFLPEWRIHYIFAPKEKPAAKVDKPNAVEQDVLNLIRTGVLGPNSVAAGALKSEAANKELSLFLKAKEEKAKGSFPVRIIKTAVVVATSPVWIWPYIPYFAVTRSARLIGRIFGTAKEIKTKATENRFTLIPRAILDTIQAILGGDGSL